MSPEPQPSPILPPDEEPFRCEVTPQRDTVVVRPVGELDLVNAPALEAQINALREAGFRRLVLDLRGLSFMDCRGLHLILRCDAMARGDGLALKLIPGTRAVQRVFEIAGVAERLPFVTA